MLFAGISILFFSFSAIIIIAQYCFYKIKGRIIWRAFMPLALRRTLFPNDKITMNSMAVVEEFVAVLLTGSFFMFPLIFVHIIGLIKIF